MRNIGEVFSTEKAKRLFNQANVLANLEIIFGSRRAGLAFVDRFINNVKDSKSFSSTVDDLINIINDSETFDYETFYLGFKSAFNGMTFEFYSILIFNLLNINPKVEGSTGDIFSSSSEEEDSEEEEVRVVKKNPIPSTVFTLYDFLQTISHPFSTIINTLSDSSKNPLIKQYNQHPIKANDIAFYAKWITDLNMHLEGINAKNALSKTKEIALHLNFSRDAKPEHSRLAKQIVAYELLRSKLATIDEFTYARKTLEAPSVALAKIPGRKVYEQLNKFLKLDEDSNTILQKIRPLVGRLKEIKTLIENNLENNGTIPKSLYNEAKEITIIVGQLKANGKIALDYLSKQQRLLEEQAHLLSIFDNPNRRSSVKHYIEGQLAFVKAQKSRMENHSKELVGVTTELNETSFATTLDYFKEEVFKSKNPLLASHLRMPGIKPIACSLNSLEATLASIHNTTDYTLDSEAATVSATTNQPSLTTAVYYNKKPIMVHPIVIHREENGESKSLTSAFVHQNHNVFIPKIPEDLELQCHLMAEMIMHKALDTDARLLLNPKNKIIINVNTELQWYMVYETAQACGLEKVIHIRSQKASGPTMDKKNTVESWPGISRGERTAINTIIRQPQSQNKCNTFKPQFNHRMYAYAVKQGSKSKFFKKRTIKKLQKQMGVTTDETIQPKNKLTEQFKTQFPQK